MHFICCFGGPIDFIVRLHNCPQLFDHVQCICDQFRCLCLFVHYFDLCSILLILFVYCVFLDTYQCDAKIKHYNKKFTKSQKAKAGRIYSQIDPVADMWDSDDPAHFDSAVHRGSYSTTTLRNVPFHVLSPITTLQWLYLCPNWRNNLDFNFQRPSNWTDRSPINKFNHSFYVKYHNLLDWHDFAFLNNGVMLHAGGVYDPHSHARPKRYHFVTKIEYDLPGRLLNAQRKCDLDKEDIDYWTPVCRVYCKYLWQRNSEYVLDSTVRMRVVDADTDWSFVSLNTFDNRVISKDTNSNNYSRIHLPAPKFQHPDVAANKPFFFVIQGMDKYHHTQFTGPNSMDTHGFYWWLGNYNSKLQFDQSCSFSICQAPSVLGLTNLLPRLYIHWEHLMKQGCLLWHGDKLERTYGMVSHHIGDMQDRNVLLRKRGTSAKSRCDGMLWLGHEHGVKWPVDFDNLLTVGCVTPGPYLLRVWEYLNVKCVEEGLWQPSGKIDHNCGKTISLTKATRDVFNRLPIDSTLKAPLEINHTTLLGCLALAFEIEWVHMHEIDGFDPLLTRPIIVAYLNRFWDGINGIKAFLKNKNHNIMVFNQMHHSWCKLVEIMLSLPRFTDFTSGVNLMCNLIRLTGCIFTCNTKTRCQDLMRIAKPILNEGMLCSYLILCSLFL